MGGGHETFAHSRRGTLPRGKIAFDATTFRWQGVEGQAYKFSLGDAPGMGWRGVQRFTIAGPPLIPSRFELRYFELAPGGYSSLEKHTHAHLILALRGRGTALVGAAVYALAPLDLVYVPPDTPHRWVNEGDEPFGFLCPVDAERDPPRPVTTDEWAALEQNPVTRPYVF
jgi:quercetin dioxygenase-like cupin family protein